MDLFGRKRIAQLEESLEDQKRILNIQQMGWKESETRELALMSRIRDMDQLIFAMSQCTDWPSMQPIFAKLKTFTDARMIEESKRIEKVLIPEMKKAYLDPNETALYGGRPERLR